MSDSISLTLDPNTAARAAELRDDQLKLRRAKVDRMFAVLLVVQYGAGIIGAPAVSPYAWDGKERILHMHVWVAILAGAGITLLPVMLAIFRPGTVMTRHVIAASQMLSSALLIHLTGGRIETHFHVFGSLAFLAFYLDWKVIITPRRRRRRPLRARHLLAGVGLRRRQSGVVALPRARRLGGRRGRLPDLVLHPRPTRARRRRRAPGRSST